MPGGELTGALPDGQQVGVGAAELAAGGEAGVGRRFDGNLPDQQAAGAVMGERPNVEESFFFLGSLKWAEAGDSSPESGTPDAFYANTHHASHFLLLSNCERL